MNFRTVLVTVAICAMLGFGGGAARAQDTRPPALPSHLNFFTTSGSGGPINPGMLVGFNPQPDPPGDGALLDLADRRHPSLTLTGSGAFTILFGFADPSGVAWQIIPPDPVRGVDGHASSRFLATAGDGSVFRLSFDISGIDGSIFGFNPQPDPPGDYADSFIGFAFVGDPMMSWTLESGDLGANGVFTPNATLAFDEVPEPMSLALLATGMAGLVAVRRRGATERGKRR
jgi:hypothetical protein